MNTANDQVPFPSVLSMKDVVAGYWSNDVILNHVHLEVAQGQITTILGPNGSGKSTVLRALSGFISIRSGEITLDGSSIVKFGPAQRLERGVALLPQGRSVFPGLSVEANLKLGAWLLRRDRERRDAAVESAFDRYPSLRRLRHKLAGGLSGGQARLLEFARSLVLDPEVLLIDEPSVGLAPNLVDEMYDEIAELRRQGRTIVLVDQNVRAAVGVADYLYVLTYGSNYLEGKVGDFTDSLEGLIRQWLSM